MARLVEVSNPPADILRSEGFGVSQTGEAVAPTVEVRFPRMQEVTNMEELPPEFAGGVQYSGGAEGLRALGSGLTFGNIDELEAMARAPFSDEDYKTIRNRLRAQQEQFGKDYPKTQMATEIIGGLALPAGVLGSAYKAGSSLLGMAKAGATVGAATGGLTGAGVAKEVSDIPSSAAKYAAGGAVLGAAVPPVLSVGGKLVGGIVDSLGLTNANKVASKKLQSYLDKENLTPDQVKSMLDEYRRLGVPDPVIADVGATLRGAGYSAQVIQSPSKTATEKFLENRQSELANSISSGLQQKANVNSQGKFGFDYITQLAETQQAAAKKAYPQAHSKDIPATPFRKYTDREVFAKAYDEAVKSADVYGEKLPALEQIRNAQYINTEILHKIKIGLDRVIDKETDKTTGKVTGYGSDVSKIKQEFNDLIKYYNKDYANANAKFADISRLKEAYSEGLDYMKMETSQLSSMLKKMTPAEKESFRVGMISDITNRLSKFKGGNPVREVFQSDRQKDALRYAFESESQFNDFVRQLEATGELVKTFNRVRRTSGTVENASDLSADAQIAGAAVDAAKGNVGSALMQIINPALSRAGGFTPEVSEIMKQQLFSPYPARQAKILDELRQTQKPMGRYENPANYSGLLGELQALTLGK
jgi:hypothetical protein